MNNYDKHNAHMISHLTKTLKALKIPYKVKGPSKIEIPESNVDIKLGGSDIYFNGSNYKCYGSVNKDIRSAKLLPREMRYFGII